MNEPPRLVTEKFHGVITNVSPSDLPVGAAQDQYNCRTQLVGQLDIRPGIKPVTFSNATTATSNNIIAMYQVPVQSGNAILYEDSAGNVKFGNSPII